MRSRPFPPSRWLPAALLAVSMVVAVPPLALGDDGGLQQARQELKDTKEQIRARAAKMRAIQRDMNRLATQIARNRATIAKAESRIAKLEDLIGTLDGRMSVLEARLAERTREAYILGPGAPILYLLTATSAADAVNRLSFLDEMNRRDGVLAAKVGRTRTRLSTAQDEIVRANAARELAAEAMRQAQVELRKKMAQSRTLFAQLQGHKHDVLWEISRIRPFAVCPVAGPHAIADGFGIWVHHTKKEGGDHIHQGNDITAPTGTPIVAPFDGTAVVATNKIGGLAVKVYGEFGYVYNAHLSRFGKLGPVLKGDVIGYVGSTGNAGGPHDHFEWHPGNGPAVDPNSFLLQVC
jgi:murein DD-endopeptidase MepM/ murein hydrolase activator NlpD